MLYRYIPYIHMYMIDLLKERKLAYPLRKILHYFGYCCRDFHYHSRHSVDLSTFRARKYTINLIWNRNSSSTEEIKLFNIFKTYLKVISYQNKNVFYKHNENERLKLYIIRTAVRLDAWRKICVLTLFQKNSI